MGQNLVQLSNGDEIVGKVIFSKKKITKVAYEYGKLKIKTSEVRDIVFNYDSTRNLIDTVIKLENSHSSIVPKGEGIVLQSHKIQLRSEDMIYLWGTAELLAKGSVLGSLSIYMTDPKGQRKRLTWVRTHGRGSREIRDQMSVFWPTKVVMDGEYTFELIASNSPGSIGEAKFLFDRFQIHLFPSK